jgi:hypothetical protein
VPSRGSLAALPPAAVTFQDGFKKAFHVGLIGDKVLSEAKYRRHE